MKIHRAICRLDFTVRFALLDHLGRYAQLIQELTSKDPFSKQKLEVNLLEHWIQNQGKIGDTDFVLKFHHDNINAVLESAAGLNFERFSENRIYSTIRSILHDSEFSQIAEFKRIGFRFWVIIEREQFSFQAIHRALRSEITVLRDVFSDGAEQKDIAVTIEDKLSKGQNTRVQFGPYSKDEGGKYFNQIIEANDGLIFDVDLWERNIAVPKLDFVSTARDAVREVRSIVAAIENNVLERINGAAEVHRS